MSTPVHTMAGARVRSQVRSVGMTALQQALVHLALVAMGVVAIVVLVCTGNLTTLTAGIVLALTGFGNIGVAGLPTNGTVVTTTSVKDAPVVPVVPANPN